VTFYGHGPDTLANLGPLRPMASIWEGTRGWGVQGLDWRSEARKTS